MILRLEQYLARAAGDTTGAIPENPETNTEAYLAILAGENRQAPEPITRLDMYLYNLVGGNYPIPTPNTRIEQYLAKACGLDIEVPTPITREEQLWYAIAQPSWQLTTLTGTLPLSFKSKGEALTNYKLYGTSEGAGEETENLFDINGTTSFVYDGVSIANNSIYIASIGSGATSRVYFAKEYSAGTYTITVKFNGDITGVRFFSPVQFQGGTYNVYYGGYFTEINEPLTVSFTEPFTMGIVAAGTAKNSGTVYDIMLTAGSTAPTSYIPYGYKLPMVSRGDNYREETPIYIGDTKLAKDEYVSYAEQKVYKRTAQLWDEEWELGIWNISNGQKVNNLTNIRNKNKIPIESSTTYYWYNNESDAIRFTFFDVNGDFINSPIATTKSDTVYSFTSPANAKFFCFYYGATEYENCATLSASTLSSYTPYLQPTDPPAPLPEITAYKGENTLSCSEELGEVSITGYIKEAGNG